MAWKKLDTIVKAEQRALNLSEPTKNDIKECTYEGTEDWRAGLSSTPPSIFSAQESFFFPCKVLYPLTLFFSFCCSLNSLSAFVHFFFSSFNHD